MSDELARDFSRLADQWVCSPYSMDLRFIARQAAAGAFDLLDAAITLGPLPLERNATFKLDLGTLFVGCAQFNGLSKKKVHDTIEHATRGVVHVYGRTLRLPQTQQIEYYTEMTQRDRWVRNLHLRAIGDRYQVVSSLEAAVLDDLAREATLPFDGLADVAMWLGLHDPSIAQQPSWISIRVNPPVDLFLPECRLAGDRLDLAFVAHGRLAKRSVAVAVRAAPGDALGARMQIAQQIEWTPQENGLLKGKGSVSLRNADQALVMLLLGGSTVRREWFLDSKKARNNRLVAIQESDADLRMIKRVLYNPVDSGKFETGVAALLFLLGFSPCIQVETDAPDLVVATPGGRLAIVECTTRIADLGSKVGKLVDRRRAIERALTSSGHPTSLVAVLVCALNKDQIPDPGEFKTNRIVLIAGEQIRSAFDRIRNPMDPDVLLGSAFD